MRAEVGVGFARRLSLVVLHDGYLHEALTFVFFAFEKNDLKIVSDRLGWCDHIENLVLWRSRNSASGTSCKVMYT